MKEMLIQFGTGLLAKLIRYALTAVGGTGVAVSMPDGQPIHADQLAGGIVAIVVALGWSLWEDRVKAKKANSDNKA